MIGPLSNLPPQKVYDRLEDSKRSFPRKRMPNLARPALEPRDQNTIIFEHLPDLPSINLHLLFPPSLLLNSLPTSSTHLPKSSILRVLRYHPSTCVSLPPNSPFCSPHRLLSSSAGRLLQELAPPALALRPNALRKSMLERPTFNISI
jgi:hypothetical protein